MDEKKHDVSTGVLEPEGRTYSGRGTIRTTEGDREPISYTYRVVHTQESVRLLDLRVASNAGVDFRHIQQLLGSIAAGLHVDVALDILQSDGYVERDR